jgi:hypothetical protein
VEAESASLNPLAALLLAVTVFVTLGKSRQSAVKAILLAATLIPLGQQLVVAGLHFPFYRIMILVGFCRVMSRREYAGFKWNAIDKIFLAWAMVGFVCGVLRGQVIPSCAGAYNSLGAYFLMRILITDPHELIGQIRFLAVLVFVIAICMFVEYTTRHNPFFVFGGVSEILEVRDDRVRCQGPFRSSNVAGAFPSTLLPLMIGLLLTDPRDKKRAILGIIGCGLATVLSNSSGPLMCATISLLGLAMWRIRDHMSLVRRGIVFVLIVLNFSMKVPVWWIIAKISDLIGGGGWHRAFIIDVCLRHVGTWWLVGTSRTIDWAPDYMALPVDPNNLDITNHFVAQAAIGGIGMLALFISILVVCFKSIGRLLEHAQSVRLKPIFIWSLGVALAAHTTGFFSISYFDQIQVSWFWFLAVISSLLVYAFSGDEIPADTRQTHDEPEENPIMLDNKPLKEA